MNWFELSHCLLPKFFIIHVAAQKINCNVWNIDTATVEFKNDQNVPADTKLRIQKIGAKSKK